MRLHIAMLVFIPMHKKDNDNLRVSGFRNIALVLSSGIGTYVDANL